MQNVGEMGKPVIGERCGNGGGHSGYDTMGHQGDWKGVESKGDHGGLQRPKRQGRVGGWKLSESMLGAPGQ